jgi:FKBP-type peptidyl-prolyl cis-trans isomerase
VEASGGVEVLVVKEGSGDEAGGAPIDVRYAGYFLDGKSFDSGVFPGIVLGKTGVIRGWHVGLAKIREGEKRRLVIPPALAYGEAGRRPNIPPNATLVFDVERIPLLKVETVDLAVAAGPQAQIGSTVLFHYAVKLRDGTLVEESPRTPAPKPVVLELGGPTPARWLRGIPGMRVGGKRILRVPAALGYGKPGKPPKVGPDTDVVYEVELIEVR